MVPENNAQSRRVRVFATVFHLGNHVPSGPDSFSAVANCYPRGWPPTGMNTSFPRWRAFKKSHAATRREIALVQVQSGTFISFIRSSVHCARQQLTHFRWSEESLAVVQGSSCGQRGEGDSVHCARQQQTPFRWSREALGKQRFSSRSCGFATTHIVSAETQSQSIVSMMSFVFVSKLSR